MLSKKIKEDFWWVGSKDPGLRIFDIVVQTDCGTTYNSYLLKGGEKTVLFEAAKEPFIGEFISTIEEVTRIEDIDILVLDHTEPDHTGAVETLLKKNPDIVIYATTGGVNLIKEITDMDLNTVIVKDGDELDIGGRTLRFIMAPNLHWPDTMFTYIPEEKILVTCDAFGAHYCYENVFYDEMIDAKKYEEEARYYFDCIMSPFKADILRAVEKIRGLDIEVIANGHGPFFTNGQTFMIDNYRKWASEPDRNQRKTVVIPYVSAYGYTKRLAKQIAEGVRAAGEIDVKEYDMVVSNVDEVLKEVGLADGILLGTPTIVGEALPPIWNITTSLNARRMGGRFAGAFGAYGWSGEGVPHIMERLKQLKMKVVGDGFRVRFKANDDDLAHAFEYGKAFGTAVLTGNLPEEKS